MAVNTKKVRTRHSEDSMGGEILKFDEGETKIYIHPPCEPEDTDERTKELPWLDLGYHFKVGSEGKTAVCLDVDRNPIIAHPIFLKFLEERNDPPQIKLDEGCPVCQELPNMSDEDRKESRFQMRHVWGATELAFRRYKKRDFVDLPTPEPKVWMGGVQIHNGLQSAFSDDDDITNMDGAMFVRVEKEGTGPRSTKYTVEKDMPSFREPVSLSKVLRRLILDAMTDDCNLFRVAANFVKGTAEVRALVSGVAIAEEDRAEEEPEAPPAGGPDYVWKEGEPLPLPCFGLDVEDVPECVACPYKWDCAKRCEAPNVPGEESEPEPEPVPEAVPENETKAQKRERMNRAEAAKKKAGSHPSGLSKEELAKKDDSADAIDQVEAELAGMAKGVKAPAKVKA